MSKKCQMCLLLRILTILILQVEKIGRIFCFAIYIALFNQFNRLRNVTTLAILLEELVSSCDPRMNTVLTPYVCLIQIN